MPAGDRVTRVFAENRLLVSRQVGGKWTLHLLEMPAGGGKLVDRPVTGVADDFNGWMLEEASDTRGAAFWYKPADDRAPWRTALLDFDSAALTYVPTDDFGLLERPHLAGDTVIFYALDKQFRNAKLYVIDRAHPTAPGHLIDIPEDARLKARAIGDWLLYPETGKNTIRAVPVTGGPTPDAAGRLVRQLRRRRRRQLLHRGRYGRGALGGPARHPGPGRRPGVRAGGTAPRRLGVRGRRHRGRPGAGAARHRTRRRALTRTTAPSSPAAHSPWRPTAR